MKLIIAGSRNLRIPLSSLATYVSWAREAFGYADLTWNGEFTELVSGGARGIDQLGEEWAAKNGIKINQFIPNWNSNPGIAGKLRNKEMAEYADALLAVWDGLSNGTAHMISHMTYLTKPTYVVIP